MLINSTSTRPPPSRPSAPPTSRPVTSARTTCCPERTLHLSGQTRAETSQSQNQDLNQTHQLSPHDAPHCCCCCWWLMEKHMETKDRDVCEGAVGHDLDLWSSCLSNQGRMFLLFSLILWQILHPLGWHVFDPQDHRTFTLVNQSKYKQIFFFCLSLFIETLYVN